MDDVEIDFKYPLVSKEIKRLCIKTQKAYTNFMKAKELFNNLAKDMFPEEYEDMIRADADSINAEIDYLRTLRRTHKL